MSKPFDASLKHLWEQYPADWVRYLGIQTSGRLEVVDSDLATGTAAADKVIRIHDRESWLLHVEFQAGRDPFLGLRILRYNVLLNGRHNLPVQSLVVLLHPRADQPKIHGEVQLKLPNGRRYLDFSFDVVRLWEQPVGSILSSGLGTLPLAPLTNVSMETLPGVIRRMEERLTRETSRSEAASLWTATYVLLGLRYHRNIVKQILQGVHRMEESDTYQAIVEEGMAKGINQGAIQEARKILLRQGRKQFGPASADTRAVIAAIEDLRRLEELSERLLDVSSWEELLSASPPRRRNGPGKKRP